MTLKKLTLVMMLIAATACAKKAEEAELPSEETPTDGSQSASQLAGSGYYCDEETTTGGSYARTYGLTLNADGTYAYGVWFYDSATCSTATGASGNNYASYSQAGTYTLNGFADIGGVGTEITFTPAAQSLTIRSSGGAIPQAMATWVNTCSYSPGFNTSADDMKTVNQHVCMSSGSFAAQDFPVNGATNYTNVVYNDGSTLQIGTPSANTVWGPFGTSIPVTFDKAYIGW